MGENGRLYGQKSSNTALQETDAELFGVKKSISLGEQLDEMVQHFNGGVTVAYDGFISSKYVYINEQFTGIFGYTREEFMNEAAGSIYNLVLPAYVSEVKAALATSSTSITSVQFVYQARRRDGSVVWVRSRSAIHYLQNEEQIAYIIFYDDITSLKKTEERIRTINEKLANSEIFLHLNLKTMTLLEYRSAYEPEKSLAHARRLPYKDLLLEHIYENDKKRLWDLLSFESLIENYQAGNTRMSKEYRRYMPNGDIRWFAVTVILLEGTNDEDISALLYAHDINDRMKSQVAKDRTIDLSVDDITVVNIANGLVTHVKEYDGYSIDQPARKSYDETLSMLVSEDIAAEDKERCAEFFRLKSLIPHVREHGSASISYWISTKHGANIRKNVNITYLDSTQEDLLMIGRDITELFEKEREQQMALQHAVELADFANKAKSDFLSRMSHDMRTPLNAILGLAKLSKEEQNVTVLKDYLESIQSSGEYLLSLICDLLDLSKIENGKMVFHREVYPLEEFIHSINTIIKPLMDAKHIDFQMRLLEQSDSIIVDKIRFNQIFHNLLSNAAKYTPDGGRVEFWSEYHQGRDGKFGMRFHIRDNGIGMSEEFLKVLFDPYSQEYGSVHKEQKGTGLGLSIVKQIVELCEGKIQVQSELGKGTEFIVDLYAFNAQKEKRKYGKARESTEGLKGIHVLIVDDTEINCYILKRLLELCGCLVDVAMDGREAVMLFEEKELYYYDIILTDLGMPIMDGFEEARTIRAMDRPDARVIPIIAATADGYEDIYQKVLEAGMNERLVKPINAEVLYDCMLRLIGDRKIKPE